MADQLTELLGTCENVDKGCFASDEGALRSMLYMDDAAIRVNYGSIAHGANDAAEAGVPLDEATYCALSSVLLAE